MHLLRKYKAVCFYRYYQNDWRDHDSYSWKSRDLNEIRKIAQEYLFSVENRKPIHDSIRQRAKLNENRLKYSNVSVSMADSAANILSMSMQLNQPQINAELDAYDTKNYNSTNNASSYPMDRKFNASLNQTENSGDVQDKQFNAELDEFEGLEALSCLPKNEIEALLNEFYSTSNSLGGFQYEETSKILTKWFHLRRKTSTNNPMQGIPEQERKEWSPWYLKDIIPK